jgi:NAD(P)-dependent dehydrogenase (short-subunit alcohol dehydrogenase family)
MYGGLDLRFTTDGAISNELKYLVSIVDPRLRRVELQIQGGGVSGTVNAFARVPPVVQPPITAVAGQTTSGEFAGSTALIIGGSRGLGELTAKLIAAGGGRVIITYATGKTDAETLASEINDWGGTCEIVPYDVRKSADQQLEALKHTPTHLYYFATPMIFGGNAKCFSPERFAEFNEFYVHGFYRIIEAIRRRTPDGMTVFYPSSVFVENRPQHMTEYAMSKAAGEVLCADIARSCKDVRVLVERLPRLRTDQTSTLIQVDVISAVPVMLQIVRQMNEQGRRGEKLPSGS